MAKLKIELTLSIGYQGQHREVLEVDDSSIPEGLGEDDLVEWLHENYWREWAAGYIDGGVSIVERGAKGE